MSITLAAADTIAGVGGAATSITYTITGDEVAAGADAFKVLAQGQLPAAVATIYTVPASTIAIVKSIHLVNTTAGTVTASLSVKGTAAANRLLPPISILAGGFAVYGDDGWKVYNDQGQVLGIGATGATGAAGGGVTVEEVDGTPTVAATKLVLPNGTLAVVGTVATYTPVGGSGVIVKDEGVVLTTDATTLDFVGAGVVASGVGASKTITIAGGSGSAIAGKKPVQSKVSNAGGTNTNSLVVTLGAAPTNGNLLIAVIGREDVSTITSITQTNVTWTQVAHEATGPTVDIWKGVVAASAGTAITIACSSTIWTNAQISEWAGITGTVDQTATAHYTSIGSFPRTPELVPTLRDALVIVGSLAATNNIYSAGWLGPINVFTDFTAVGCTVMAGYCFPGGGTVRGNGSQAAASTSVGGVAASIT